MKRIAIIGGGIVGLSVAYKLLLKNGNKIDVTVLEKETGVGTHQSSHNSGVLHAGLAYQPGSQKALLAYSGIRQMIKFCKTNNIEFEQCGKLVVATHEEQVPQLKQLRENGIQNGLKGLELLNKSEMRQIEPYVDGVMALGVPEEGIADFPAVCHRLRELIIGEGGKVLTEFEFKRMEERSNCHLLESNKGEIIEVDHTINCGGLYSDVIAKEFGLNPNVKIIPFRGDYYRLKEKYSYLVNNLIYPVADPQYPFLGVHFSRMTNGKIEAGPNAVLAFRREGYGFWQIKYSELFQSLTYPGLIKFTLNHPKMVFREISSSISKSSFVNRLKPLIPEIQTHQLEKGRSGVRAQAMDRSGNLVGDFKILQSKNSTHLINAPSPAATASLAIADWVVDLVL